MDKIPPNTRQYIAGLLESKKIEGETIDLSELYGYPGYDIGNLFPQIRPAINTVTDWGKKAAKGVGKQLGYEDQEDIDSAEKAKDAMRGTLPGGAGQGMQGNKDSGSRESKLFGKSHINLAGAAGLYAAGEAASLASKGGKYVSSKMITKAFDAMPNDGIMKKFGKAIGRSGALELANAGTSLLNQVSDLTGKSWWDANFDRIGQQQLGLAAQGAGSPWVPLAVPQRQPARSFMSYNPGNPNQRFTNVRIP